MDKKKIKNIAFILLVAGLAIYAGTLHMKLNSYHQFVEGAEYTPASILLDEDYTFYSMNGIIKESIEKEEISNETLSILKSTYWNVREHFQSLSNMAEQLEGQEVNWNHFFEQISEIIYTLEDMDSKNDGSSKELNEEQLDFFQEVLVFNDGMYSVFEKYESVPNKERKDFDRDYWVDYVKDVEREMNGIVVRGRD
ncbi:hypothetical protein SAMN04487936_102475 [Halobacillus dabanensis]|uniref:Uncharacterized protein n=1 Tax=Halobacillus dabanensis TaxID=240302 RepID=A0A1I3S0H1_HALDA|nr:hypothetical protein [Halobacillus dabanensis]SFJ51652.1 hypothetical protein SAMN04487936_102475 [Halobacillus dabanensis]